MNAIADDARPRPRAATGADYPEHGTLHHGDCLDVLPTLAAGSVDLVIADLPYGITRNPWDCAIPLDLLWPELRRVGKAACVFVFTATMRFACTLAHSQPRLFRYDMVWLKNISTGFYNARRQPLRKHELILVFCASATPYTPQMSIGESRSAYSRTSGGSNYGTALHGRYAGGSERLPVSVLPFPSETVNGKVFRIHPTQKPVALLRWLIATYSRPGDLVLDPTSGVASTAVAALREGRRFICIERDAGYYGLAKERVAAELHASRATTAPPAGSFAARAAAWADARCKVRPTAR